MCAVLEMLSQQKEGIEGFINLLIQSIYRRSKYRSHQKQVMQQSFLPAIWSTSACTIPFVNKSASFLRSRRFQFNSIYYKDDPCRPKNQQDPLSRPQMVLSQFRKKIKQASKTHYTVGHLIKKKKIEDVDGNQSTTINIKASRVTGRLYESPQRTVLLKYDFNGNRSSHFEDKNQKETVTRSISPKQFKSQKIQPKQSDNVYITSTLRTDFSRPLNFHPGPGSYHLSDENVSRSSLHKQKSSKQTLLNTLQAKSSEFHTVDSLQQRNQRKSNIFAKRIQLNYKK